jgi:hypothetical protein
MALERKAGRVGVRDTSVSSRNCVLITVTVMERVLFRMLENASLPLWRGGLYYYSTLHQSDCLHLRK